MNDSLEALPPEIQLDDYLAEHNATIVTTEGSHAVSVHGELELDGHRIPYMPGFTPEKMVGPTKLPCSKPATVAPRATGWKA
ncbi:hypothetical protein [Chromobacterium phragmitis]|uniref:Uncharacterized protein n=1 Tax=Chromobacterium phragmitis TaxID=2202141 RepID=A0ABV0IQQ8_9NEIS